MPIKKALVIGITQHDDSNWPRLKLAENDAKAVAEVLADPEIGQFDDVKTLLNPTVPQMRIAIAELFDGRQHKPDDLLLLYFSGHGQLDDGAQTLYFIGKDTRSGPLLLATGLEAGFVASMMHAARSRRQVIILDACHSGAFGKSVKGEVPTKAVLGGKGRFIVASSDALQLSWENQVAEGDVMHSFFTQFLVEGLKTGAADRGNDGLIDIEELYDHIAEGMAQSATQQNPIKDFRKGDGKLILARSPIRPFERVRGQLTDKLVAAEAALERGDLSKAENLLQSVIDAEPDTILGITAAEMLREISADKARLIAYADVKRLVSGSKRIFRIAWIQFTAKYPDYDPDGIGTAIPQPDKRKTAPTNRSEPLNLKDTFGKTGYSTATRLLPEPFGWIEIPGKAYSIGKYPVTNAQYKLFMEAGGYQNKKWWTAAGWEKKSNHDWMEPRFWTADRFIGDNKPVVGVSWYESVAFCLWLSEQTGEKIMLPTEEQWQYAAQGDDGRQYPWGNEWDGSRCNNSVKSNKSQKTSAVTLYEGKGDSPFGVVDMAGNVWEWCLTDYEKKTNDMNSQADKRVLRGGSWYHYNARFFRVSRRLRYGPNYWYNNIGFRLALSA